MRRYFAVMGLLAGLLLAGCGAADPLAGKWRQDGPEPGWEIEFAADGRFVVHGDGPDGSHDHDHCNGTWTLEGERLQLQGRWDHAGKDVRWTGTLADGALELATGPGGASRRFRRG